MDIAIIYGLLTAISWGITDFLIKIIVGKADDRGALLAVQAIGLVAMLPLLFFVPVNFGWESFAFVIAAGFFMAVGYAFYFKGLIMEKLSIMATISGGEGAITALLGIIILAEALTGLKGIGVILVLGGITVLSIEKLEDLKKIAKGAPLGLGAMTSFGVKSFLYAIASRQMDAVVAVVWIRASAVFFVGASIWDKLHKAVEAVKIAPLLVIGAGVFDALGFLGMALGYQNGTVPIVATVAALYPAVCIFLGAIFLKEKLNLHQYAGAVAVLAGLLLISL